MEWYRVWFEQVNQQYVNVEARTLESAMIKAERKWKKYNLAHISCVEKDGKQVYPSEEQ